MRNKVMVLDPEKDHFPQASRSNMRYTRQVKKAATKTWTDATPMILTRVCMPTMGIV